MKKAMPFIISLLAVAATTQHPWCQQYDRHWLGGTEPDGNATNDLRVIAQTCLNEGGRAVLGARGLCEVWLKEHFGEGGCLGAPQERSAVSETESKTLSGLMILPNPANDVVRLLVNPATMPGARQIQVLNLNGQLVHSSNMPFGATEWRISVHGWPEGMYVVRVMNGAEAHSLTFVVQHR